MEHAVPVMPLADLYLPANHWTLPSVLPQVTPWPVAHTRLPVQSSPQPPPHPPLILRSCPLCRELKSHFWRRELPCRRSYGDLRHSLQQQLNSSCPPPFKISGFPQEDYSRCGRKRNLLSNMINIWMTINTVWGQEEYCFPSPTLQTAIGNSEFLSRLETNHLLP